jgi:sulfate transport system ATP-binding protein
MSIIARGITKHYDATPVLLNVDLDVPTGSLVALLGPSGSGKTTLLRILSGLESADAGTVTYDGEDATHRPPRERGVGLVFQHYALFRHMTVFENVAFALRVRKWANADVKVRVNELLALVKLEKYGPHYPSQLSGGQRQRIALARALAISPRLLLLDEPFGALDTRVRRELREWLRQLHDELHVTTVLVTHDHAEARDVADQLVVINAGKVEQTGTPAQIFAAPASPFVEDFLETSSCRHITDISHSRNSLSTPRVSSALHSIDPLPHVSAL